MATVRCWILLVNPMSRRSSAMAATLVLQLLRPNAEIRFRRTWNLMTTSESVLRRLVEMP